MRRRVLTGAMAAGLLVGGVSCSGSDDTAAPTVTFDPSDPRAVVLAAATKLDDQPVLRFELTTGLGEFPPLLPQDAGVTCEIPPAEPVPIGLDRSTGVVWTEDADGQPDVVFADRDTYVRSDLLPDGAPTPWVRFDEEETGRIPTDSVRWTFPPWTALPEVDDPYGRLSRTIALATGATVVGTETIDGAETTRYSVLVPGTAVDELLATLDGDDRTESSDALTPPDVTIDIWIDDDGSIRHLEDSAMGNSVAFARDPSPPATVPDDAEVTDALDLSPELPEFPVIDLSSTEGFPCSSG